MTPFNEWGSTASRLRSNLKEAVYFLPLSFQKFLVLILSTSDRWKAEWTLEPPTDGFEHGTPGLAIQCLNHKAIALYEWVCIHVESNFSVDGATCHASKHSPITLRFTSSLLDNKGSKHAWLQRVHSQWKGHSHLTCKKINLPFFVPLIFLCIYGTQHNCIWCS